MNQPTEPQCDAILVVSFGGPEGPDDVVPFMENVTAGRGIPRERLAQVSAHYSLFGGVSPINGLNRQLIEALRKELADHHIDLPIYWGNRNWHPMLADTIRSMRDDGIVRALAFVTSAYSSSSGCRQYRDDIARAQEAVGPAAPTIDKIRVFYNHPGFVDPMIDAAVESVQSLASQLESTDGLERIALACTAHSIPTALANTSDYVKQLTETSRLVCEGVAAQLGHLLPWSLVYQSRSGVPGQPWLEPDINDHLTTLAETGTKGVVMIPIGFISDHMEVVYDLDTQAAAHASTLGLQVRRTRTPATDSRFIGMVRELISERLAIVAGGQPERRAVGIYGPNHDTCPQDCCPAAQRPRS